METIQVRVKPNSRQRKLEQQPDGTWIAHVTTPPIDGRANVALIELVAEHFDIAKRCVAIKSGASSRIKLLLIDRG